MPSVFYRSLQRIRSYPFSDLQLFLALAAIALAIDAGGYALQIFLKLSPCPLCIFQRVLYLLLTCLALLGVFFSLVFHSDRVCRVLGWSVGIVSLGGTATAGYQSWMQAYPDLATACSYSDPNLIEQFVDWLGMLYPPLFMASGLCTSKAWTLFGLSMANWSLLTFLLITVVCIQRLRQR